jgi:iron complex outermembrane receptor protein
MNQHSNATTGEFVLEYQATDNTNTYIKYARGYRQGQVNPRGFGFLQDFGQEQVDLTEVGLKTNWHGAMPGYFNIALFHNLFQNQQLQLSYFGGSSPASGICSCGKSVIQGAELDGSVRLFEGFRLSGAVAYLHTDLKSFGYPAQLDPVTYTIADPGANVDLPLAFSPEWKYSLTAAYTLPLPESIGEITLAATYSYTDSYYLRETVVPDYDLLNLNVNWNGLFGSPVDLSLFGTNVLENEYVVTNNNLNDSFGFTNAVLGEPRMYGMRLRYNFGARAN